MKRNLCIAMIISAIFGGVIFSVLKKNANQKNDLFIANIEALTTNAEEPVIVDCNDGPNECARINVKTGTVHIFFKK